MKLSLRFICQFWSAADDHTVYTLDKKIRHLVSHNTSIEFPVILCGQYEIEHIQPYYPLINIYEYLVITKIKKKRYLPEDQHTVH